MRIAFIGGGHMTTSLVGGLVRRGTRPGPLRSPTRCRPSSSGSRASSACTAAPTTAKSCATRTSSCLRSSRSTWRRSHAASRRQLAERRRVVVSIAAGIRLADLERWLGNGTPIVRAMPNRPALIGAGITALYAGGGVTAHDRDSVEALMSAAGDTVWLDQESQMDVVTAISGSGPAYFFLLIEALESAGIDSGLPAETARRLAVETARGAGRMAAESGEAPAVLREQVTSRGGTTAAALEVLEAAAVRDTFRRAVAAATLRSAQLADEFGGA